MSSRPSLTPKQPLTLCSRSCDYRIIRNSQSPDCNFCLTQNAAQKRADSNSNRIRSDNIRQEAIQHANSNSHGSQRSNMGNSSIMSIYNLLHVAIVCPRCGQPSEPYLQIEFGRLNMIDYRVGDVVVEWVPHKPVKNGGRPESGTMAAEGYATCNRCEKDFFVTVFIEHDRITRVELDGTKTPLIPG